MFVGGGFSVMAEVLSVRTGVVIGSFSGEGVDSAPSFTIFPSFAFV